MKCPNCKKTIKSQSRKCPHCGVRLVRRSDKMARKMTMNARISMASGGLLVILGIILAINSAYLFGGLTFAIGAALMVIGKMMG